MHRGRRKTNQAPLPSLLLLVLLPPRASAYAVSVSAAEVAAGQPRPATAEHAAAVLSQLGFVALKASGGVVPPALISRAHADALAELDAMLSRVESVGIDPTDGSFSFNEVVHRSRLRYDVQLDLRRTPPSAPWEELSAAAAAWSTAVLEAAGVQRPEPAVHGLITSLPGAATQRFHSDGSLAGGFNAIVPLVDTAAQASGTEFWPCSHEDAAAAAAAHALLSEPAEAADAAVAEAGREVVQPQLRAGELPGGQRGATVGSAAG